MSPSPSRPLTRRMPQARLVCLGLGFAPLRSRTEYLRVPHPSRFVRTVGSYALTFRTLCSSLLGTLEFAFVVADLQVGSWGRSNSFLKENI